MIDAATGEILFHQEQQQAPAGGKGFEELLGDLEKGKAKAEAMFAREVIAHEDRDRLLEEKFQQALDRAKDDADDGPPPSPFDCE